MPLVTNIAGFNDDPQQLGTASVVPAQSPASKPGLFSSIVKLGDTASGFLPQTAAVATAIQIGINLLPPGALKTRLEDAFKKGLLKGIMSLLKGRTYTTGNYKLGERYIDQVQGGNVGYRDVHDEVVPEAILMFTILFGVRITTIEDLDALQGGSMAYYARPDKQDIPQAAVQRAVYLKQTFFPDSTYNIAPWNVEKFGEYPLVAPIPDPVNMGALYSGPLPGGGQATNGVIMVNGKPGSLNSGSSGLGDGGIDTSKILLIGGAAVVLYFLLKGSKNRK